MSSEELKIYFPQARSDEGSRLAMQLMDLFEYSAEDLKYKWEAYTLSKGNDPDFCKSFEDFKSVLKQELERPLKKSRTMLATKAFAGGAGGSHTPAKQIRTAPLIPKTPTRLHQTQEPTSNLPSSDIPSSPSAHHYQSRVDKGKILESFNESIKLEDVSSPALQTSVFADIPAFTYNTMYQKLTEVGRALDDQIERVKALLVDAQLITAEMVQSASNISHDEVVAIGRIVSESLDDQRLTPTNMMLESSRRQGSSGSRVRLNVSNIPEFSFFAGQIIAVRGTNTSGTQFNVTKLLELPQMPKPKPIENIAPRTSQAHIIIAAGPYTLPGDLDFEPLRDLIKLVVSTKPSAVILAGPFLESDHQSLLEGSNPDVTGCETIDDVFKKLVSPLISEIDPQCPVIMMPALEDACVKQNSYPQAPFPKKRLELPRFCRCLPNPSTFSLDELVITMSTLDALQELVRSATKRGPNTPAGASLAFSHILRQRRLYPLSPAPVGPMAVNLDYPHLNLANIADVAPHLLIVPSNIMHCTRLVDGVLCVNPGRLTKRAAGGTYARVILTAQALKSTEYEKQIRVDIVKI